MVDFAYLACSVIAMMSNKQNFASPNTEWLTPGEAAAALGVGLSTLARMADRGDLRAIRPTGGHRRYRAEDVEALIARSATWEPKQ